eukprot:scaffold421479_cov67-Attheya_sp.AAC.1
MTNANAVLLRQGEERADTTDTTAKPLLSTTTATTATPTNKGQGISSTPEANHTVTSSPTAATEDNRKEPTTVPLESSKTDPVPTIAASSSSMPPSIPSP